MSFIAGPFAGTLTGLERRRLAVLGGTKGQQTWPAFWCNKDKIDSCVQIWAGMTEDQRTAVVKESPGYASNLEEILRLRYTEDPPGARFDEPLPDLRGVLALQLVSMASVLDRLDRGDRKAALGLLQEQVRFNRRSLAGASSLIGKMVTLAAVERDVLFVRELTARRQQDFGTVEALAMLLSRHQRT